MNIFKRVTWKTFLFGIYMWGITALLTHLFPGSMSPGAQKTTCLVMFPVMQLMGVIVLGAAKQKK